MGFELFQNFRKEEKEHYRIFKVFSISEVLILNLFLLDK